MKKIFGVVAFLLIALAALAVVIPAVNAFQVKDTQLQNLSIGTGNRLFWFLSDTNWISEKAPNLIEVSTSTKVFGYVTATSTVTASCVNTGNGDCEVYAQNQALRTTDNVAFSTVTATTGFYLPQVSALPLSGVTTGYTCQLITDSYRVYVATKNPTAASDYKALW